MRQSSEKCLGSERIRLVSVVEAETVTGPMKPLLMFTRNIQSARGNGFHISHSAVTTIRAPGQTRPVMNGFLRAATAAGLPVDVIRERFLFDWRILSQLANWLAVRRPHIVETHDFKSHFIVWLLRSFHVIRDVHWVAFHHGYTRMSAKVLMYQQLDRLSLRSADRVVTVCKPFVEQLTRRGVDPRKVTILANAIEDRPRAPDSEISDLRHSLGVQAGERVVVSVGRLSREKGHETLVAAFRKVREDARTQNVRLILVGDGGEALRLKASAADLGDTVLFTGHVDDPWPYYCLADVFVLPSHSEGSPLALFEAMSAGLPIVATAVGGIPETLSNGVSALLVAAGADSELARALQRVLVDVNLANALRRGAQNAVASLSAEQYSRKRILIYEEILAMRAP